jgi:hypothetical protein
MSAHDTWPLDAPEHLAEALREQDPASDAAALMPALLRLAEWQAPAPTAEDTRRLLAVLTPLLPTPQPAMASAAVTWKALLGIVARQPRLIHRGVWIASALAMASAAVYGAALHTGQGAQALGLFLPVIAAAGAAFLYGHEADPGLEIALATPTAGRLILASRLALLVGYDAALALGVTLIVAAAHGEAIGAVAALWMGPMALLSAGSLLVSLLLGPFVAAGAAFAVWFAQFTQLAHGLAPQLGAGPAWQTSPLTFAAAAIFLLAAFLYAPRRERLI